MPVVVHPRRPYLPIRDGLPLELAKYHQAMSFDMSAVFSTSCQLPLRADFS